MYKLKGYLQPTGASLINIDTGQRNFAMKVPNFSFSYAEIVFNDDTLEYFYRATENGAKVALSAPQKTEVQAYILKMTKSDPWSPTVTSAPSIEIPPKNTLSALNAIPVSSLLAGTTCYVIEFSARFIWDGASWGALSPLTTTWSAVKNLAATLKAGTTAILTDVNYQPFMTDGTKWKPIGRALLSSFNGRLAAPVATLTGITAGIFGVSTKIPAGMLKAGNRVLVRTSMTQQLAFTCSLQLYFGPLRSAADAVVTNGTLPATANLGVRNENEFYISSSSTAITSPNWLNYGGVVAGVYVDKTVADMNTTDMYVTCGIASGNNTNTYSLISHSVEVI